MKHFYTDSQITTGNLSRHYKLSSYSASKRRGRDFHLFLCPFFNELGYGGWIRTNGMADAKSVALPLGLLLHFNVLSYTVKRNRSTQLRLTILSICCISIQSERVIATFLSDFLNILCKLFLFCLKHLVKWQILFRKFVCGSCFIP